MIFTDYDITIIQISEVSMYFYLNIKNSHKVKFKTKHLDIPHS